MSTFAPMIFYFSGTGNTRWAAEQLAAATQEKLLFIPEELKGECTYTLADNECIGFCFPVHGWQPPHIVRQFIDKLQITNALGHYAYSVCTCGDSIGLAMDMLQRQLKEKGITLQSTLSLIMPESYVCLPFMYTDTPEREHEKTQQAAKDLEAFCNIVKGRETMEQLVKGAAPWLMSHVIGGYFNRYMITDRKFTVDEDVCIHCGKCAEVCPTGDIMVTDRQGDESSKAPTPEWKNDSSCTCCLSCYHHCPVHAINYGSITRKRGQYYYGHR